MRRFLVDVNVILDVLLDRQPHATAAAALWSAIETGRAEGRVPAHGLTTIYDLARQARSHAFARRCVADILSVFQAAPVDDAVLRRAMVLGWPDFEDAVCTAAGEAAGCTELVTRNSDDFDDSPLPVLDPATAAAVCA